MGKAHTRNTQITRDTASIPGLGRAPGRGNGNPLQYSYLRNPVDKASWWALVQRVAKSQDTPEQLSAEKDTAKRAAS